jgi:hypothetical protein
MANFCVKCGGALDPGVAFCRQCGNSVSAAGPASPQSPQPPPVFNAPPAYAPMAPPPPPKGNSAVKFILIAFFVICALGIAGVISTYYFVKHKVATGMAEFKDRTGVDVGAAIESASKTRRADGRRRDGCLMLTKDEAQRIIGVDLARVDGSVSGSDGEHCFYYPAAGAARANADQLAEKLEEMKNSSGGSKEADMKKVEGLVKNMVAGANDGSAPVLEITIFRGDAQVAITGLNLGTALGGVKPEKVDGPWDDATMGPLNSTMAVRKGENGFMIDLRQLPDGREKGFELAKIIAARL